ncbi:hypothetical protein B0T10DRAFT_481129 [Thelonectria olida]|uniref:Ubiquitin-like domain-containing protein n=1 Tax=Thelonectria olida TaxID=1576542 RepID=A0A9P8WAX1_9HYPO|nr:hypothetical protein B0T10DRAFT_481129 [Thelonectria olida]
MEAALTFGSLGDIIAVCQLAFQLAQAIHDRTGVKEYQNLRDSLDKFVQVLMHVVAIYEQYEPSSPELKNLARTSKSVVDECAGLIKTTLDRIVSEYHGSMQPGGSGSKVRDIYKRGKWWAREKSRLVELQEQLHKHVELLSVLTALATRHSSRADNATVLARIEEVRQEFENHEQVQRTLLDYLTNHETREREQPQLLAKIDQQLAEQAISQNSIASAVLQVYNNLLHVKDLVFSLSERVTSIQVMFSNVINMRGLDPTKDLLITIEDATGVSFQISEGFLEDWEGLNQLLEIRFKHRKGYDMVLQRKFALQDDRSEKDLHYKLPITATLRRGMKINMSMVFVNAELVEGFCPGCKTEMDAPVGATIQCQKKHCGMRFQMLKLTSMGDVDSLNDPSPSSKENRLSNSEPSIRDDPSDFQRVRLLGYPRPLSPSHQTVDSTENPDSPVLCPPSSPKTPLATLDRMNLKEDGSWPTEDEQFYDSGSEMADNEVTKDESSEGHSYRQDGEIEGFSRVTDRPLDEVVSPREPSLHSYPMGGVRSVTDNLISDDGQRSTRRKVTHALPVLEESSVGRFEHVYERRKPYIWICVGT